MKIWSSFVTIESDQNRWIDGWWTRDDDNDMPAPETYKNRRRKNVFAFFFVEIIRFFLRLSFDTLLCTLGSHAFHFAIVVLRRKRNPISSNRIQILNFSSDWRTPQHRQKKPKSQTIREKNLHIITREPLLERILSYVQIDAVSIDCMLFVVVSSQTFSLNDISSPIRSMATILIHVECGELDLMVATFSIRPLQAYANYIHPFIYSVHSEYGCKQLFQPLIDSIEIFTNSM